MGKVVLQKGPGLQRVGTEKQSCLVALLITLTFLALLVPSARAANNKFLLFSDVHFNPMADATLVAELAAGEPAQWETILQRSKPARFSQYGQDTNWWLLQSALDQMRKTLPQPAFVMYTGDMLAHNFPKTYRSITHDDNLEHYRSFVLKTVEFLAMELRKRFPAAKILVTPGNDDDDCGDYTVQAGGAFLSDTAPVAAELAQAGSAFTGEWKALGSYNVPHPVVPGLRILSLNTVFFSNNYQATSFQQGCSRISSNAPSALLTWLASSLESAKQAHQRVWLMFHIPPGIDGYATTHKHSGSASSSNPSCKETIVPMWGPEWTQQFDTLLEKFQDTVLASFSGHTHTDDFRLVSADGVNQAFVLVDPPVSPIYRQNPSFRVVSFAGDGSLADQTTYYLTNLKTAGGAVRGKWKREYRFSKEWNVRRLDLESLGKIYGEIQGQPTARDQWLQLYNVSSSDVVVPPDTVRGLYCAIGALSVPAYASCYCGTDAGQDHTSAKP